MLNMVSKSYKHRGIRRILVLFSCLCIFVPLLHCTSKSKQKAEQPKTPQVSVPQAPSVQQLNPFVCPEVKKLVLQLIWKQKFMPVKANDESIFFMPKDFPKDFLQRIVVSGNEIVFFDENGIFIKKISINSGSHINISQNNKYIVINSPDLLPKDTPPDYHWPSKVTVINSNGDTLYNYGSFEYAPVITSNYGATISINPIELEGKLYDNNGNVLRSLKPTLAQYDERNMAEAAFSASNSFALLANDPLYPHEQGEQITPTCFVSLYDGTGKMVWTKRTPVGYMCIHGIGVSDAADRVLVIVRKQENPPPPFEAILYDGNGGIVKNIPSPIAVNLQNSIQYNSAKEVFVLRSVKNIFLVDKSGNVSIVDPTFELVESVASTYVAIVGTKSPGNNVILRIFDLCGNLLLEENLGGNKNDLDQTSVRISNDGSVVSVKFSNEIRHYRIRKL